MPVTIWVLHEIDEDGKHTLYSRDLNWSGIGDSLEDAKQSFVESLQELCAAADERPKLASQPVIAEARRCLRNGVALDVVLAGLQVCSECHGWGEIQDHIGCWEICRHCDNRGYCERACCASN